MAMPRQFVRFENYFKGFEQLSWDYKLQKHKEFAEAQRARSAVPYIDSSGSDPEYNHVEHALNGCWLVKCDEITGQWDEHDLRLQVNVRGMHELTVGKFDWGILEGIMQFDTDFSRLPHASGTTGGTGTKRRRRDSTDSENERADAADAQEDIEALQKQVSDLSERLQTTERLLLAVFDAFSGAQSFVDARRRVRERFEQHEAHQHDVQQDQAQAHRASHHPRRVHFIWCGRETREGQIQLDDDSLGNRGWIEFTDDACVEFNGVIDAGFVGQGVKWSGYKLGYDAPPFRRSWEEFSEAQYEEDRVSRWH